MGTQLSKFETAGVFLFATQPPLDAVSGKRVARCNVRSLIFDDYDLLQNRFFVESFSLFSPIRFIISGPSEIAVS